MSTRSAEAARRPSLMWAVARVYILLLIIATDLQAARGPARVRDNISRRVFLLTLRGPEESSERERTFGIGLWFFLNYIFLVMIMIYKL